MCSEESGIPSGNQHFSLHIRPLDLDLSDDGSSVVSESDHDHSRRKPSTAQRQRRAGSSQLSPSFGGSIQHPLGSPLPAYPVSIRQQLAIIKQMEQPSVSAVDVSSSTLYPPPGSCSPGGSVSAPHCPTKTRKLSKIHKKNERGETPLHVAARRGEYRQCKKLVEEGAVVNAVDYAGWTPLHEACSHGHVRAAKVLIGSGADINISCAETSDTPLHDAALNGNERLVWLLLHSGADRERLNNRGKRPIDVCPPECTAVRNLLSSPNLPTHCPSTEESPPHSPSSVTHMPDSCEEQVVKDETSCRPKILEESDVPLSGRRSIWREEVTPSLKIDEIGAQPYDFDEELSRENMKMISEWPDVTDARRAGRSRNLGPKSRFLPPTPQRAVPVSTGEKRKQKGRRRGRGGSIVGVLNAPSHSSVTIVDDVYEFRSSPESDIDKSAGDTVCDTTAQPSAKRQRLNQTTPSPSHVEAETIEEVKPENGEQLNEVGSNEPADDRSESGRKVPPLRISLTRTPSEEGTTLVATEETPSTSTSSIRRNTRNSKNNGSKKQCSSEDSIKGQEEATQRMTRSKFRQQLRNQNNEASGGRKTEWKEQVVTPPTVAASPMTAPTQVEEQVSVVVERPSENIAEKAVEAPDKEILSRNISSGSPYPMILMQKNTYEGFRGLRALIEKRWIESMEQPPSVVPESPPNHADYMTIKRNYTTGNIDPCPQRPVDEKVEQLCSALKDLYKTQYEMRHNMEVSHKIEKERLQMLAETEYMRMLTRKANPKKDSLSTVRILHETEVYNAWFLDVPRPIKPVIQESEVKKKFGRLAELMFNRQKMESDALFAEQLYTWKQGLQNNHVAVPSCFEDMVVRVPTDRLILNL